jgi:hypothetical protein
MNAADREALASRVVEGHKVVCRKLRDMAEDIRALWTEFDALMPGEKIMGCTNRTQFCVKYLDRELRSVRYMLDGGNHNRHNRSKTSIRETVSPMNTWELKVMDAAEAGDAEAKKLVAAVARGERATLSSARRCPTIPANCPLCGLPFPSKTQLRKHGRKDHGVKDKDVALFLDPDRPIREAKKRNATDEEYQGILEDQTVPVLDEAWKAVSLLLPTINDGNENKFVRLMAAAVECAGRQKPHDSEDWRLKYLRDRLREAAFAFNECADTLEPFLQQKVEVVNLSAVEEPVAV